MPPACVLSGWGVMLYTTTMTRWGGEGGGRERKGAGERRGIDVACLYSTSLLKNFTGCYCRFCVGKQWSIDNANIAHVILHALFSRAKCCGKASLNGDVVASGLPFFIFPLFSTVYLLAAGSATASAATFDTESAGSCCNVPSSCLAMTTDNS